MPNIITKEDHQYHFKSEAMGINIEGKKHYEYEMKRRGMIPKDKADDIARRVNEKRYKTPSLTKDARELISSMTKGRVTWNSGEKITLNDKQIDGMKKMGITFDGKKIKEMTK